MNPVFYVKRSPVISEIQICSPFSSNQHHAFTLLLSLNTTKLYWQSRRLLSRILLTFSRQIMYKQQYVFLLVESDACPTAKAMHCILKVQNRLMFVETLLLFVLFSFFGKMVLEGSQKIHLILIRPRISFCGVVMKISSLLDKPRYSRRYLTRMIGCPVGRGNKCSQTSFPRLKHENSR